MRKVLTGLAVVAALAFASVSHAVTGTAHMSWTGCNAPVITDLAVADASTNAKLYVYVDGHDDATQSYEVWVLYGSTANHTVPDAWRFDPVGCQGSTLVTIRYQPPAALSKTCLSFQDAGGAKSSFQVTKVDFSPNTLPYDQSLMLVQLADLYGLTPNAPVAGTRYFLFGAEFDQTFGTVAPTAGSNCGGLGTPMCFNINRCGYVPGAGGDEINFHFFGGDDWATANAGGAGGCQETPVQPRTWGQIKSQYRN